MNMRLIGLLFLSLVPTGAGAWRLAQLASSPVVTPDNARFVHDPLPAIVHIVTATVFCILGAFQVAQPPRAWHRYAGRFLAPLGIAAGLSGVWLTLAYWSLTRDGPVLFTMRLAAGSAMTTFIALGTWSILRRDVALHRAWMLRGYAIGMGAGTQVFTHLPALVRGGEPSQLEVTIAMGAGWLINIVVAELVLRARPSPLRAAPASP